MADLNQLLIDGFNLINRMEKCSDYKAEIFGNVLDELNLNDDDLSDIRAVVDTVIEEASRLTFKQMLDVRKSLYNKLNKNKNLTHHEWMCLGLVKVFICVIGIGEYGSRTSMDEYIIADGLQTFKNGTLNLIVSNQFSVNRASLMDIMLDHVKSLPLHCWGNPINYSSFKNTPFGYAGF